MNNQISFFKKIVQNNSKQELIKKIKNSPLKHSDIDFMVDCVLQLSYEEMMTKYGMTKDGVYKRKTRVFERFMKFWLNRDSC